MCIDHRFKPSHNFGGLHCVGGRADFQIDVWVRQGEVFKQLVAHVAVVMLARMDKQHGNRRIVRSQGAENGRHLHKVGPRADDTNDGFHGVVFFRFGL